MSDSIEERHKMMKSERSIKRAPGWEKGRGKGGREWENDNAPKYVLQAFYLDWDYLKRHIRKYKFHEVSRTYRLFLGKKSVVVMFGIQNWDYLFTNLSVLLVGMPILPMVLHKVDIIISDRNLLSIFSPEWMCTGSFLERHGFECNPLLDQRYLCPTSLVWCYGISRSNE